MLSAPSAAPLSSAVIAALLGLWFPQGAGSSTLATPPTQHAAPTFLLDAFEKTLPPTDGTTGGAPLVHEVALQDLEHALLYRNGDRSAFLLPLEAARDENGAPLEFVLLDGNSVPVPLAAGDQGGLHARLVSPEQILVCLDHPAFAGFGKKRMPVNTEEDLRGPYLDRDGEFKVSFDRFGAPAILRILGRVLGTAVTGPCAHVSILADGQEVAATDCRRADALEPPIALPPARGRQELTLRVTYPPGDSEVPRLLLVRLGLYEKPLRERLVLEGATATDGWRLRWRARPPVVAAELGADPRTPNRLRRQRRLVGLAGSAAVILENAEPVRVSVDGIELPLAVVPARELPFEFLTTGDHEVVVDPVNGTSASSREESLRTLVVQPGALAHADPEFGRGPLPRTVLEGVRPVVAHVEFQNDARRSAITPLGTDLLLPLPRGPAARIELGLAVRSLCDAGLLHESIPCELALVAPTGTQPLETRPLMIDEDWAELTLPIGAREESGWLRVRAPVPPGMPQLAQLLRLVVADPTLLQQETTPRPANVLVYLIDTLRADHTSTLGYARATTPALDALGAEGIVFERAYAQAPWTRPAVATLFTSMLRAWHGAGRSTGLPDELETFAERLRASGRTTAAFCANAQVHAGGLYFEQGFGRFVATEADVGQTRSDEVNAAVLPWLDRHAQEPFFLYVHTIDPHAAYDPPPATRGKFTRPYSGTITPLQTLSDGLRQRAPLAAPDLDHVIDLYDEEILFNDMQLGVLLERLKQLGIYDDTLVIVLSDHGEEFQEHGAFGHGGRLWEELLHVPMVVKLPRSAGIAPARVAAPVRQLDLLPTVLAQLGLPGEESCQGVDLRPWLGDASEREPLWVIADEQPAMRCLVLGSLKLIQEYPGQHRREKLHLYDLAADPHEQSDLFGERPETARHLAERLDAILQELDERGFVRRERKGPAEMTDAERKALRKLGYIGK